MTPRRTTGWRLYIGVLAPSLVVVLLVGAMAITSVRMLGAVRGYVGGESLWSKARAEAVQHLLQYAHGHDDRDLARFEQALTVPLSDRSAREEMERAQPNPAIVRAGLLAGGIHPDDIDKMATLFKWFGRSLLFEEALNVWKDADTELAHLREQAALLQRHVENGPDHTAIQSSLAEIARLNTSLQSLEVRFTASLGHAARITETLLMIGLFISALLLSIASFMMIRRPLQRQEAQQWDLILANRRWELAVAGSGLGLFELSAETGAIHFDGRAAEMCGLGRLPCTLSRDEMYKIIVPEDAAGSARAIEGAWRRGELYKNITRVALPDGDVRHIESMGRIVRDPVTGGRQLMGVCRDVTQERAQAEAAMERDAAEKVAVSQRAFLSRLSHELRTPLNAVLGFAQLLSIDKTNPLSATQHKQVRWILDAGDQLLRLVEDVLDLSKVEMGEIDMKMQPCDTAAVLRSALPLVEGARERFGVHIVSHLPDPAPCVMADRQRLLQIFVNLLSNGCKYNRPGGEITLTTRLDGDQVHIDFSDSGIGLTQEDASGLFQPFRRVPMASAHVEGSGLGLYIVRQLVERMQGRVGVRSEPGVGSCFTVTLRLAAAEGQVCHSGENSGDNSRNSGEDFSDEADQ